jgi:hypothetical protein
MDGIRLHDNDSLEAYGVDKKKLVEEITRAYAHQLYIDGFFNGDPHPGISILCLLGRSSVTLLSYPIVPLDFFVLLSHRFILT